MSYIESWHMIGRVCTKNEKEQNERAAIATKTTKHLKS
jgi:hypothetical protein